MNTSSKRPYTIACPHTLWFNPEQRLAVSNGCATTDGVDVKGKGHEL
jgi:hypothetical protein